MEQEVWQTMVTYYLDQKGNLLYTFPDQYYVFLSCTEKYCLETEILWWNELGEFP